MRDRAFLKNARAQLDADHFGLEKIKKRLIEYLAVVRLKAMQAEHEMKQLEEAQKAQQLALVPKNAGHTDVAPADAAPSTKAVTKPGRKPVKGPILL